MTQQEAFGALPVESRPAGVWHCVHCGGTETTVDPSRPSVDPRYAVGRCRHCSKSRATHKEGLPDGAVMGHIALVADAVWDPAKHQVKKVPKVKVAWEDPK